MIRRVVPAVLVAAALVIGGCGGAQPASEPPAPTPQQAAAAKLIAEYEATPGCGCTGETRAKERAASLYRYAGENLVVVTR